MISKMQKVVLCIKIPRLLSMLEFIVSYISFKSQNPQILLKKNSNNQKSFSHSIFSLSLF